MCGIFASTDYDVYKKLYIANQIRGTFASSLFFKSNHDVYVKKIPGKLKLTDSLDLLDAEDKYNMYMGHVQAPTSNCRTWDYDTSHPFEHGDWVVAHNGVLENFNMLKESYSVSSEESNPVDSSIIPILLSRMWLGDEVKCIMEMCNELRGTFSCWIYNKKTRRTYVVRSGSTLHYNAEVPTISSIETTDTTQTITEGVIYEMSIHEGIYPVGEFKTNSPFIIL